VLICVTLETKLFLTAADKPKGKAAFVIALGFAGILRLISIASAYEEVTLILEFNFHDCLSEFNYQLCLILA